MLHNAKQFYNIYLLLYNDKIVLIVLHIQRYYINMTEYHVFKLFKLYSY